MIRQTHIHIYICCLLVLLSCNNQGAETLNSEIYNDIFPELVFSNDKDFRTVITPSPEQLKEFEKIGVLPKKENTDKRKLLIVVNDSIYPIRIEAGAKLNNLRINKKKVALNLRKLSYNSNRIKLVNNQEYALKKERLNKKYYYWGHLNISSIFLNKSLKDGYLITSFTCGKLCSITAKIIIKKANKKWVISEYINLSIS